MTLRLYNSLKDQKEDFVPLRDGRVSLYVCGPTVYNDVCFDNGICHEIAAIQFTCNCCASPHRSSEIPQEHGWEEGDHAVHTSVASSAWQD